MTAELRIRAEEALDKDSVFIIQNKVQDGFHRVLVSFSGRSLI